MNYTHVTARRPALVCATLAMALAACGPLAARPADTRVIYYNLGDAWTTTKRRVRFYDCRSGAMVCRGPASYLDVTFHCRCE
jgi:hypothetical protein